VAFDPFVNEDTARANKIQLLTLPQLLAQSDFVTLHSSLTQGSRGLLDAEHIAMMKPGARVINVARGALIDLDALHKALSSGALGGAAIDVFEEEPPGDLPLFKLPNVVITPHLGASTAEAQRDVSIQIAEQALDALHDRDVRNAVNFPPIDPNLLPLIRPYLKLAEKIGAMQSHLIDGRLLRVEVEYRGDSVAPHAKPLTVALLRGLLAPMLGAESVNYVNTPVIANERGIMVTQAINLTEGDYTSLLSCKVVSDQGEHLIAGTCFNDEPRIVQLDGFRIDAVPDGMAVMISSRDVPGVVGRVGTILGNLDTVVPDYAMKALRDLPEVLWVKQMAL
jgi:D-3-phosphoglycerate dehydrogenase / 2-oxoglutarate reductase